MAVNDSSDQNYEYDDTDFNYALTLISGKAKVLILFCLAEYPSPLRNSTIKRLIPNVSEGTLSHALRQLEKDHLVDRYEHLTSPPRVEYTLSKEGEAVIPLLHQLSDWGKMLKENQGA